MNITRLNTLNDDKVIIKKEGGNGGGDASTIEYVDISTASEELQNYIMTDGITIRAIESGDIYVLPSGALIDMISHGVPMDDILAVSVDLNMAIITVNGLKTIKDDLIAFGCWESYSSLPRITKEEFYHIPQDEIWTLNTQEDYKAAWDKLYPLVERYGADYINENRLSLAPWYKSLRINGFGANDIIEYYVDIREDDEFIKNEIIGFDNFALKRKEWNDGRVTFDFVEYEG